MEQLGDEQRGALDVSILIAHKDKLYKISSDLEVTRYNEYAVIGAGMYYVFYAISLKNLPVRERILKGLQESDKQAESVGEPYVFIDTKNLEYEILDKGGNKIDYCN